MKIPIKILAPILNALYPLWCATLRITVSGRDASNALAAEKKPMLFMLWHDEFFPLAYLGRTYKLASLVSPSKDGEYATRILESRGIHIVRGSSSRDGLKALLRTARLMRDENYHACTSVDGPRGPRHVVKEGFVFLAMRTPAHIVPIRVFMERAKIFSRSWDRFQVPLPFSKVHVVFGTPYLPEAGDINPESLERERQKLQERMDGMDR